MPVTQNTIPYILSILILIDAFEDAGDKRGGGGTSSEEKVHVRVQQRNGRKCITTVAGLADDLDIKRICKAFKKNFLRKEESPLINKNRKMFKISL